MADSAVPALNSVTLEWFEVQAAAQVGLSRQFHSLKAGMKNRIANVPQANEWGTHIEAAASELAAAKALNRYWDFSVNTFKAGDIGDNLQIRLATRGTDSLILRAGDNPNHIYLLVIGQIPTFRLAGWAFGKDAMNPIFVRNPNAGTPAYFMPQSLLQPIHTLESVLNCALG